MKITRSQLKQIIREEVQRIKSGCNECYDRIRKNMGYVEDQTAPADYNNDGAEIYNKKRISEKKKKK